MKLCGVNSSSSVRSSDCESRVTVPLLLVAAAMSQLRYSDINQSPDGSVRSSAAATEIIRWSAAAKCRTLQAFVRAHHAHASPLRQYLLLGPMLPATRCSSSRLRLLIPAPDVAGSCLVDVRFGGFTEALKLCGVNPSDSVRCS